MSLSKKAFTSSLTTQFENMKEVKKNIKLDKNSQNIEKNSFIKNRFIDNNKDKTLEAISFNKVEDMVAYFEAQKKILLAYA